MFRAIWENSLSAVRRIILQDPGVLSEKDSDNFEPLHLAAYLGHPGIVRELLLSGASIDATGPGGDTALMLAIQQGHSDTTSVLLQHGADVQIYDDQGSLLWYQLQSMVIVRYVTYCCTMVVRWMRGWQEE